MQLFPYQVEGAGWLAQRERAGLHDEMGVGKTATLIRALNNVQAGRFIVIGPAGLRENFIGEWRKFSQYPLKLCKGQTIHDYVAWQRGRFDGLITSFELATKWYSSFRDHGEFLDAIVIDEAHYLKTVNAARTRAVCGPDANMMDCWASWCVHGWWSTGTPIPNDPRDIYTFLRFCGVMPLTEGEFESRYFDVRRTTFGKRCTVREEMVDELRTLIDNNRIRRMQKEVGIQLPPIFLTTALLDGDTTEVRDMLKQHPGLDAAILAALEQGRTLPPEKGMPVATLRRLIGEAKAVPYAHQLLDELRWYGGKRVVFGIHINVLEYVRDFLVRNGVHAVLARGGTDVHAAVREFQENPQCQVIVGQIRAAGEGHTMTAACEIDVLESGWTPKDNAQVLKRVHRIGQTKNVRARFMTLANSFDGTVNRTVAEKTAAIAEIEGEAMHAAPPLLT